MENLIRETLVALNHEEQLEEIVEYLKEEWFSTVEDLILAVEDGQCWTDLKLPGRLKLELKRRLLEKSAVSIAAHVSSRSKKHSSEGRGSSDLYTPWIKCFSEEHNAYYFYNEETEDAAWELPEGATYVDNPEATDGKHESSLPHSIESEAATAPARDDDTGILGSLLNSLSVALTTDQSDTSTVPAIPILAPQASPFKKSESNLGTHNPNLPPYPVLDDIDQNNYPPSATATNVLDPSFTLANLAVASAFGGSRNAYEFTSLQPTMADPSDSIYDLNAIALLNIEHYASPSSSSKSTTAAAAFSSNPPSILASAVDYDDGFQRPRQVTLAQSSRAAEGSIGDSDEDDYLTDSDEEKKSPKTQANPKLLKHLVEMGFEPSAAGLALSNNGNNLSRAAAFLISQQTKLSAHQHQSAEQTPNGSSSSNEDGEPIAVAMAMAVAEVSSDPTPKLRSSSLGTLAKRLGLKKPKPPSTRNPDA